jgi:hypothetical protein
MYATIQKNFKHFLNVDEGLHDLTTSNIAKKCLKMLRLLEFEAFLTFYA